jgi:stalled ribosome alternative rescue factor ArfA
LLSKDGFRNRIKKIIKGSGSLYRHARESGHPAFIRRKAFLDSRLRGNDEHEINEIPDFFNNLQV